MNKQIPSYYRRTLADGTVEMFPAGPSGAMPVFPGTASELHHRTDHGVRAVLLRGRAQGCAVSARVWRHRSRSMNFQFDRDGITYRVSTQVGEGRLTDVVVLEEKPEEVQMEISE